MQCNAVRCVGSGQPDGPIWRSRTPAHLNPYRRWPAASARPGQDVCVCLPWRHVRLQGPIASWCPGRFESESGQDHGGDDRASGGAPESVPSGVSSACCQAAEAVQAREAEVSGCGSGSSLVIEDSKTRVPSLGCSRLRPTAKGHAMH